MKISFFSLSPNTGGSEKVLINIANEFAKMNYQIEFIFCNGKGILLEDIDSRIKIINLNSKVRYALFKFYDTIVQSKPDVVISGPQSVNFVALLVRKFTSTNYKTIITHHNYNNVEIKNSFLGFLNPLFIRTLYNSSSAVIAVSNGIKNHLINEFKVKKSKIYVIDNPVTNSNLFIKANEEIQDFPFNQNKPIILSVGRLSKIKNYPLMLKAFSYLIHKQPAYLVLVGEGEERENIKKEISELNIEKYVFLLGEKSNPYKYMAKSNLLLLTSISESFGMVLVESLALGIPVVSTDTKGAIDVLDNGKYGTILSNKDSQEIANIICENLNTKFNKDILMERGKYYSASRVSEEYLTLIKKITS